jgi:anti-sigma regulatory factor (Ser/Thr protein kinase)
MDVRARTTLPASVGTPAVARAFARHAVAGGTTPLRVDDVTLVVSELVTNAVVHGTGDVTLHVVGNADGIRVEVGDDLPSEGELPVEESRETVRGLLLVSRIARHWGVRAEGAGKVVWADLAG